VAGRKVGTFTVNVSCRLDGDNYFLNSPQLLGKAQDRGLTEVAVEDYNLTGGREVARPQASDQEVGAHALHSALLPCVATDCDEERGQSRSQGD